MRREMQKIKEELNIILLFVTDTSFQNLGPSIKESILQACDFIDNLIECPHGGQWDHSLERAKQSSIFVRNYINNN